MASGRSGGPAAGKPGKDGKGTSGKKKKTTENGERKKSKVKWVMLAAVAMYLVGRVLRNAMMVAALSLAPFVDLARQLWSVGHGTYHLHYSMLALLTLTGKVNERWMKPGGVAEVRILSVVCTRYTLLPSLGMTEHDPRAH